MKILNILFALSINFAALPASSYKSFGNTQSSNASSLLAALIEDLIKFFNSKLKRPKIVSLLNDMDGPNFMKNLKAALEEEKGKEITPELISNILEKDSLKNLKPETKEILTDILSQKKTGTLNPDELLSRLTADTLTSAIKSKFNISDKGFDEIAAKFAEPKITHGMAQLEVREFEQFLKSKGMDFERDIVDEIEILNRETGTFRNGDFKLMKYEGDWYIGFDVTLASGMPMNTLTPNIVSNPVFKIETDPKKGTTTIKKVGYREKNLDTLIEKFAKPGESLPLGQYTSRNQSFKLGEDIPSSLLKSTSNARALPGQDSQVSASNAGVTVDRSSIESEGTTFRSETPEGYTLYDPYEGIRSDSEAPRFLE